MRSMQAEYEAYIKRIQREQEQRPVLSAQKLGAVNTLQQQMMMAPRRRNQEEERRKEQEAAEQKRAQEAKQQAAERRRQQQQQQENQKRPQRQQQKPAIQCNYNNQGVSIFYENGRNVAYINGERYQIGNVSSVCVDSSGVVINGVRYDFPRGTGSKSTSNRISSSSNFNCDGCRKCRNCRDCEDCSNCNNCGDCEDCSNCNNCRDCGECSNCTNCSECSECEDCVSRRALIAAVCKAWTDHSI